MQNKHLFLLLPAMLGICIWTCSSTPASDLTNNPSIEVMSNSNSTPSDTDKVVKSKEEWAKCLTAEEFRVLRDHGTERAFTGEFWNHHDNGVYTCAGCGLELFSSETKFDSGTGWPSYYAPYDKNNVEISRDNSLGMLREEVHCRRCGGHLGHVFDDGPRPTGKRYCINSISLDFKKK
jgi:peptide-methionine (R)-S-oxide reductase